MKKYVSIYTIRYIKTTRKNVNINTVYNQIRNGKKITEIDQKYNFIKTVLSYSPSQERLR